MPLALTAIQVKLLVACQRQLACTLNVLSPPPTGMFWLVGVMLNAQLAPAWVTVTVCTAMDNVPARGLAPRLASATNVTPESPAVPDGPDVMCSQGVCVLAV